jgi:DNA polymerase III subunit delta
MVALKSSEFDSFLARGKQPIVLIFGPDAGLVRERVQAVIARAVEDPNDPFSLARLDGDALFRCLEDGARFCSGPARGIFPPRSKN